MVIRALRVAGLAALFVSSTIGRAQTNWRVDDDARGANDGTASMVSECEALAGFAEVYTVADFLEIRDNLTGNYYLCADLDFGGEFHGIPETISNPADASEFFSGIFDGGNHTVSNIYLDDFQEEYVGLFRGLGPQGIIRHLILEEIVVSGNHHGGALVGQNYGTVHNVKVLSGLVRVQGRAGGLIGESMISGVVFESASAIDARPYFLGSNAFNLGGLIGRNRGIIDNCSASGTVKGNLHIGGLVGYNGNPENSDSGAAISSSHSTGMVIGSSSPQVMATCIGGLVGSNRGTVSGCYALGDVSGVERVGGLIGASSGSASETTPGICDSHATGDVFGQEMVGGLIGFFGFYGSVGDCYAEGNVNGSFTVGGLIGRSFYGNIDSSLARGDVTGDTAVGGLVGTNTSAGNVDDGKLNNCYAEGTVWGSQDVGGVAGVNAVGQLSNCYYSGVIEEPRSGNNIGGVVGLNTWLPPQITACYFSQTVNPELPSDPDNGNVARSDQELMSLDTFLPAWDITYSDEPTPSIWKLAFPDGTDFPRLCWESGSACEDLEECPADINGDGEVGPFDLAIVLGFWGPNPGHPADLDNDDIIGPADLALLLGAWGPCP